MEKKFTFYELLTMMKNGEAPKKVIFKGKTYFRIGGNYVDNSNGLLVADFAKMYSIAGMYNLHEMVCTDKILTEKENAYLSAVLKPFKERAMRITKMDGADGYNLVVDGEEDEEWASAYYYFPVFPHDSEMYRGMEVDRAYTPQELGLWEEE